MVSDTSRAAYKAIENDLSRRQQEVLETLEHLGEASNKKIADYLGWEINRVTGRVNELAKKGRVKVIRVERGEYKHSVKVWGLKRPLTQASLL